jgi:hypothetical protein
VRNLKRSEPVILNEAKDQFGPIINEQANPISRLRQGYNSQHFPFPQLKP